MKKPASLILFCFVSNVSLQIEIQRLQQIVRFIFFSQLEELAFQGFERSGIVPVVGEVLFVLAAFGVGGIFFEVAPDVGRGVFSVTGTDFFGEDCVDQAIEFLARIIGFVLQQRADGLIDRRRPFEDGIFVAAPFFFQKF